MEKKIFLDQNTSCVRINFHINTLYFTNVYTITLYIVKDLFSIYTDNFTVNLIYV